MPLDVEADERRISSAALSSLSDAEITEGADAASAGKYAFSETAEAPKLTLATIAKRALSHRLFSVYLRYH